MTAKVVELVEGTTKSSSLSPSITKTVNKKVFTSGEQLASFMETLSTNQLVRIEDVAQLVALNYEEVNPPRSIFQTADFTGSNLAEEVIDFIIRKVPKAELFSEKMESYRPFELFSQLIFQKEAAALL